MRIISAADSAVDSSTVRRQRPMRSATTRLASRRLRPQSRRSHSSAISVRGATMPKT